MVARSVEMGLELVTWGVGTGWDFSMMQLLGGTRPLVSSSSPVCWKKATRLTGLTKLDFVASHFGLSLMPGVVSCLRSATPHSRTCLSRSLFLDLLSQGCPDSLSSGRVDSHRFNIGSSLCLDRTDRQTSPTLCLSYRKLRERGLHSGDLAPRVRCCVASKSVSLSLFPL